MKNTDPTNAWTGDPIPAWTITGGSAPADTDRDGMADEWELAAGSNYQVADNNVVEASGYTKLENYLNWLAAPHGKTYKNTRVDFDLSPLTVTFTNQPSVYAFSNPTNGTVTLVSNRWARFVPATNFTGRGRLHLQRHRHERPGDDATPSACSSRRFRRRQIWSGVATMWRTSGIFIRRTIGSTARRSSRSTATTT